MDNRRTDKDNMSQIFDSFEKIKKMKNIKERLAELHRLEKAGRVRIYEQELDRLMEDAEKEVRELDMLKAKLKQMESIFGPICENMAEEDDDMSDQEAENMGDDELNEDEGWPGSEITRFFNGTPIEGMMMEIRFLRHKVAKDCNTAP